MIKNYTTDDIIAEFASAAARRHAMRCPEVDRLRAMQAAGATVGEMGMSIFCDRSAVLPAIMIITTLEHGNPPEASAEVQERCAWAIAHHPWGPTRVIVERLLLENLEKIGDGALIILLGLIIEQHPNPSGFLAQIAARVPHTVRAHFAAMEPDPWPT
jgi:hypothetical protein